MRLVTRKNSMNPRILALATFVALFGASASFALSPAPNEPPPVDETKPFERPTPVSGETLQQDDPAVAADAIQDENDSLADAADDVSDDVDGMPDDDTSVQTEIATEDTMAEVEDTPAIASQPTMPQAQAPLPGRTGAQERRAHNDVARMDDNGNGALEEGEVEPASLSARFADYDIDDDNLVSVNEYQSWLGAQSPRDPADEPQVASSEPTAAATLDPADNATADSDMSQSDDTLEATAATDAEDMEAPEPEMDDDSDAEGSDELDSDEDGPDESDDDTDQ